MRDDDHQDQRARYESIPRGDVSWLDAARDRGAPHAGRPLLVCDLTQSYSPTGGGGISTYLREKRDHVLSHTPHHLLQIVPGPEDRVTVNGRHILAEVAADPVRGSPHYRFILRVAAVPSGTPLLQVVTRAVAQRVATIPSVESARVQRSYPSSLTITAAGIAISGTAVTHDGTNIGSSEQFIGSG